MKKIAFVLSIVASICVFSGCANKGTDQAAAVSSDTASQSAAVAAPAKHHRHHDFKGEAASK